MATQWLRRAWLVAAGASVMLLAACGGGSIESQLNPARIIAFGDGMGDIGQNGSRFTVNDGTANNWTHFVAQAFGRALAPASAGGLSYATGGARVAATPGIGNDTTAPSVQQQIDTFLAANTFGPSDLVLVSAGTSDVIFEAGETLSGAQTREQMLADLGQAGRDLGAQVRRLVNAGARHVVVAGTYNLGRSPWAKSLNQVALLEAASSEFNAKFLLSVVDLGERVLYQDAAQQFNVYEGNPSLYQLSNVSAPVCNSIDAGAGIGIGANQVDSQQCTTGTLVDGNYTAYLFADAVYPTPRGHQLFGDNAYSRIRERW